MAIEYRSLFCDESDIDGKQFFYIGGIECTNRRAEILKEKILELRKKENIGGEFKWTKISNNEKYINQYKDLVNIFAKDKFSKVYLMKIKKNQKWKMWSKSEEERFFKCYYNFLMMTMKTYEDVRYDIYIDDKDIQKKYRWDSLMFSLKNKYKGIYDYSNKGFKKVRILTKKDSGKDNLIQLTDVIINCVKSSATSLGKKEVQNHYTKSIEEWSEKGVKKENIIDWEFDYEKIKK